MHNSTNSNNFTTSHHRHQQQQEHLGEPGMRVLYIVTTLSEYDNGQRHTTKGSDRLLTRLLPVVVDSITSMISAPFHYKVDLYLICGYTLQPHRRQAVVDALLSLGKNTYGQDTVGLEVWDDAVPYGYDILAEKDPQRGTYLKQALSRQHRFVIKDKLYHYDFFAAFEDDMRITGSHISHYIDMYQEIQRLKREAAAAAHDEAAAQNPTSLVERIRQETPDINPFRLEQRLKDSFYGNLSYTQLQRMIPGFIRVEVLVGDEKNQDQHGPKGEEEYVIPIDYTWEEEEEEEAGSSNGNNNNNNTHLKKEGIRVDPFPCCGSNHPMPEGDIAVTYPINIASSDKLLLWETSINSMAVRKMPKSSSSSSSSSQQKLDWVALLTGPTKLTPEEIIGSYWSGRDGVFGRAPGANDFKEVAQQAGWMAPRNQILEWHEQICMGGFLPPFDDPHFRDDGQTLKIVEWWSGGLQLFTKRHACNMQRFISLKPNHFSNHLLFHTSNNKQRQKAKARKTSANHLWGQLNTVRKRAQQKMIQEIMAL